MRGQDIDYEGARRTMREVIEERRNYAIKHEFVVPFFRFSPALSGSIRVATVYALRTNTKQ